MRLEILAADSVLRLGSWTSSTGWHRSKFPELTPSWESLGALLVLSTKYVSQRQFHCKRSFLEINVTPFIVSLMRCPCLAKVAVQLRLGGGAVWGTQSSSQRQLLTAWLFKPWADLYKMSLLAFHLVSSGALNTEIAVTWSDPHLPTVQYLCSEISSSALSL